VGSEMCIRDRLYGTLNWVKSLKNRKVVKIINDFRKKYERICNY
jgi:hypothetical protein